MIASFRCADTEAVHLGIGCRKVKMIERAAMTRLARLDAATTLHDLAAIPGNRLEVLRGDRAGQYSIRVNDQWRICFTWHEGRAHDVEITDYH
ncbi:MAG TPA: type II toxin-antitoxin system RelE/ParE family toxin [Bryobacteraceae bacterium]|nr:type II toxin-antitoxin system RelE/ParE family toxin [Bryobacteraceae bacterium]